MTPIELTRTAGLLKQSGVARELMGVAGKGAGILLVQGGFVGLQTEPAQDQPLILDTPDEVRPAGDAVTIGVVRVGQAQDARLGDRLQQPQADIITSGDSGP